MYAKYIKKVNKGALTVDEKSVKLADSAEFEEEMGGGVLTEITYTTSSKEYEKAFIAFQKRYVYPKNTVITIIFALVAILYGEQVVRMPSYALGWALMAICAAMIVIIWYNPMRIRKTLVKSIQMIEDDVYVSYLYPDGLVIQTIITEDEVQENAEIEPSQEGSDSEDNQEQEDDTVIPAKKIIYYLDKPDIINREDMFIIYLKKQMFYVIPKSGLSEQDIFILKEQFKQQGHSYIDKEKTDL